MKANNLVTYPSFYFFCLVALSMTFMSLDLASAQEETQVSKQQIPHAVYTFERTFACGRDENLSHGGGGYIEFSPKFAKLVVRCIENMDFDETGLRREDDPTELMITLDENRNYLRDYVLASKTQGRPSQDEYVLTMTMTTDDLRFTPDMYAAYRYVDTYLAQSPTDGIASRRSYGLTDKFTSWSVSADNRVDINFSLVSSGASQEKKIRVASGWFKPLLDVEGSSGNPILRVGQPYRADIDVMDFGHQEHEPIEMAAAYRPRKDVSMGNAWAAVEPEPASESTAPAATGFPALPPSTGKDDISADTSAVVPVGKGTQVALIDRFSHAAYACDSVSGEGVALSLSCASNDKATSSQRLQVDVFTQDLRLVKGKESLLDYALSCAGFKANIQITPKQALAALKIAIATYLGMEAMEEDYKEALSTWVELREDEWKNGSYIAFRQGGGASFDKTIMLGPMKFVWKKDAPGLQDIHAAIKASKNAKSAIAALAGFVMPQHLEMATQACVLTGEEQMPTDYTWLQKFKRAWQSSFNEYKQAFNLGLGVVEVKQVGPISR